VTLSRFVPCRESFCREIINLEAEKVYFSWKNAKTPVVG
jgi:hypothetical protein